MKKEIEVAVSQKVVEISKKTVEFEFPSEPQYWERVDDSRFFAEGNILLAIIPKYSHTMDLIRVTKGRQQWNDFVPTKDCRQEEWLKGGSIRHEAFSVITGIDDRFAGQDEWKQITKEEFHTKRTELLDFFMEDED